MRAEGRGLSCALKPALPIANLDTHHIDGPKSVDHCRMQALTFTMLMAPEVWIIARCKAMRQSLNLWQIIAAHVMI